MRCARAFMAQPPAERALRSADACAQIIAYPAFQRAAVLLAYCAMPQECDPAPAVFAARAAASALPFHCACRGTALRCMNRLRRMRLHQGNMHPGAGSGSVQGCFSCGDRICCHPRCGVRTGLQPPCQGAGYYDRLLPELSCPKAGLAVRFSGAERVPREEWV